MTAESRSPLKDRPLRNPGQSVEEARRRLAEDKLEAPIIVAALFITVAMFEWARLLLEWPPYPRLFTVAAIGAVAFAAWRVWRVRPRLRELSQAADGERAVGQFLEALREQGYKVFHDIVSDGFNIDHVLIGPAGVFTIETKTWSKPAKGEPRIRFEGDSLLAANRRPDRDPIVQSIAQAGWLRELLRASTGRPFEVRPVVLFPGWFVEPAPKDIQRRVWVLNPKSLQSFLEHEVARLSEDDVALAGFHLSRYIRVGEARELRAN